jgi:hypothetical protein
MNLFDTKKETLTIKVNTMLKTLFFKEPTRKLLSDVLYSVESMIEHIEETYSVEYSDAREIVDHAISLKIVRRDWKDRNRYFFDCHREDEVARYHKNVANDTYRDLDTGSVKWFSNNQAVPTDILEAAGVSDAIIEANEAERDREIDELRESMMNKEYSEEELFEMRAAFGPGATVVNVLTGKKIKL